VDGLLLAEEYEYRTQQAENASAELISQRAALLALLAETTEIQWHRMGLRDRCRRVTLVELVEDIHQHDQPHVQEFHELIASLSSLLKE